MGRIVADGIDDTRRAKAGVADITVRRMHQLEQGFLLQIKDRELEHSTTELFEQDTLAIGRPVTGKDIAFQFLQGKVEPFTCVGVPDERAVGAAAVGHSQQARIKSTGGEDERSSQSRISRLISETEGHARYMLWPSACHH